MILPAKVGFAGEQHIAARGANRAHIAAEAVSISEDKAAPRQQVQVRRLHDRVAERANRVCAHVIGEEEKNVGPFSGLRRCHRRTHSCQEKENSAKMPVPSHVEAPLLFTTPRSTRRTRRKQFKSSPCPPCSPW